MDSKQLIFSDAVVLIGHSCTNFSISPMILKQQISPLHP